jgi:hypothetical protein
MIYFRYFQKNTWHLIGVAAASEIFWLPLISMSVLTQLFQDFAARLCSTEFLNDARHPDHPTAFSRRRKLPLATPVSILLTGMRMSVQAELDTFFAHQRIGRTSSAGFGSHRAISTARSVLPSDRTVADTIKRWRWILPTVAGLCLHKKKSP